MFLSQNTKRLALLIVFVQATHSTEEYIGRLWENFPPATYLCGLVSDDLERGFLIINTGLFVIGILSWLIWVRNGYTLAKAIISFWIIVEILNGIVHPLWALVQKSYQPGVITAPFLLANALFLWYYFRNDLLMNSD